ncbi:hypothetical protein C8J57DRAFT_1257665 [Mycena rebaudengoi]|nr:hypothetical protein C8J57DRAFT_1257665 [Mycena rebaudengoi]
MTDTDNNTLRARLLDIYNLSPRAAAVDLPEVAFWATRIDFQDCFDGFVNHTFAGGVPNSYICITGGIEEAEVRRRVNAAAALPFAPAQYEEFFTAPFMILSPRFGLWAHITLDQGPTFYTLYEPAARDNTLPPANPVLPQGPATDTNSMVPSHLSLRVLLFSRPGAQPASVDRPEVAFWAARIDFGGHFDGFTNWRFVTWAADGGIFQQEGDSLVTCYICITRGIDEAEMRRRVEAAAALPVAPGEAEYFRGSFVILAPRFGLRVRGVLDQASGVQNQTVTFQTLYVWNQRGGVLDTPSASPELPRGPASPASVPVDPLEVMNFWMARFREHISNLRFSVDSADGSAMIRILEPRILPQIGALIDEYFNGVGTDHDNWRRPDDQLAGDETLINSPNLPADNRGSNSSRRPAARHNGLRFDDQLAGDETLINLPNLPADNGGSYSRRRPAARREPIDMGPNSEPIPTIPRWWPMNLRGQPTPDLATKLRFAQGLPLDGQGGPPPVPFDPTLFTPPQIINPAPPQIAGPLDGQGGPPLPVPFDPTLTAPQQIVNPTAPQIAVPSDSHGATAPPQTINPASPQIAVPLDGQGSPPPPAPFVSTFSAPPQIINSVSPQIDGQGGPPPPAPFVPPWSGPPQMVDPAPPQVAVLFSSQGGPPLPVPFVPPWTGPPQIINPAPPQIAVACPPLPRTISLPFVPASQWGSIYSPRHIPPHTRIPRQPFPAAPPPFARAPVPQPQPQPQWQQPVFLHPDLSAPLSWPRWGAIRVPVYFRQVTTGDVLAAIHAFLAAPLTPTDLRALVDRPAAEERCRARQVPGFRVSPGLVRADVLGGAVVFGGCGWLVWREGRCTWR